MHKQNIIPTYYEYFSYLRMLASSVVYIEKIQIEWFLSMYMLVYDVFALLQEFASLIFKKIRKIQNSAFL